MLERDGLIRTLAEPNLTAVSGEPAKFLAGGEYPVPVVDTLGASVGAVQRIRCRPRVHADRSVGRPHQPEDRNRSQRIDDARRRYALSGISIPALKKRQAKSTVELPSGGSLALAGLISDDTRQNIDGLPGAKDIPILGTLFRSRDFIKSGNRTRRHRHAVPRQADVASATRNAGRRLACRD